MIFALLTFLAAFSIEGIGTLVSVIGLSSLFGANPIIIALAVALDVGKLVVVSLLYKHWSRLGKIMRTYGLIAAAVTMTITSAGAAGYLSASFQQAMIGTQESGLKVDVLKTQIAKYEERKKQIDDQIAAIPEKYSAMQRIRLMNQFKQEQKDLQDKINAIDKQLPDLQIHQISVEAKAGPILFIAKAFGIPVEQAVKWVILMIIFVFDPLAVFLIIAGNFLWDQRKKPEPEPEPDFEEEQLQRRIEVAQEVFSEPEPTMPNVAMHEPPLPVQSPEWAAIWDMTPTPSEVQHEQSTSVSNPPVVPDIPVPEAVPSLVSLETPAAAEPVTNVPVQQLPEPVRSTPQPGDYVFPLQTNVDHETGTPSEATPFVELQRTPDPEKPFIVKTSTPDASQARVYPSPTPEADAAELEALQEQYERREAARAGMSLEDWKAVQLAKLDRLQAGADAIAAALRPPVREQITLSSLGAVKADPDTITDTQGIVNGDAHEIGIGTGAYTTGRKPS
jgi:hypothetical protein